MFDSVPALEVSCKYIMSLAALLCACIISAKDILIILPIAAGAWFPLELSDVNGSPPIVTPPVLEPLDVNVMEQDNVTALPILT
jgi:hypothetical protein